MTTKIKYYYFIIIFIYSLYHALVIIFNTVFFFILMFDKLTTIIGLENVFSRDSNAATFFFTQYLLRTNMLETALLTCAFNFLTRIVYTDEIEIPNLEAIIAVETETPLLKSNQSNLVMSSSTSRTNTNRWNNLIFISYKHIDKSFEGINIRNIMKSLPT